MRIGLTKKLLCRELSLCHAAVTVEIGQLAFGLCCIFWNRLRFWRRQLYHLLICGGCILSASLQSQPLAGSLGVIYQADLGLEERPHYQRAVLDLLAAHEKNSGQRLRPGKFGKVALKVDLSKGRGLSTPLALVEAVVLALEQRSFRREGIYLVAQSARDLQKSGFVSSLHAAKESVELEGCVWKAWDQGIDYDLDWYYDSPLPPKSKLTAQLGEPLAEGSDLELSLDQRKSLLPVPLMFDFDCWINLATAADAPDWGIQAVLANATLGNVSNARRFRGESVAAAAAIAEIAAIPEFRSTWSFNIVSLHKYQYIGGPMYNAAYTRSEPLLWLSADPVALDRLLVERINRARQQEGFPLLKPMPLQIRYAASLGVGRDLVDEITVIDVDK